jgi:polar amino acid transport system permease protein
MPAVDVVIPYIPLILQGTVVTLQITVLAIALGTGLGLVIGLMRSSSRTALSLPARAYIELFRSIPGLLQLFIVFYAIPLVLDVDIPAFVAAVVALGMICAAYMAEVVRTGTESVGKGQWEAANSLGLRYPGVIRYVVLPQALRVSLPPAISIYIATFKETSLVSVIGLLELTGTSNSVRGLTFGRATIVIFVLVATIYFVISYSMSWAGQRLERRIRV